MYQFTAEDSARGGQIAATVAKSRAAEMVALRQLAADYDRADIDLLSLAAIVRCGLALSAETLPPVETWLDATRAAEVMEKAHRILRLERGESTANTVNVSLDKNRINEIATRIAAMRTDDTIDVVDTPPTP